MTESMYDNSLGLFYVIKRTDISEPQDGEFYGSVTFIPKQELVWGKEYINIVPADDITLFYDSDSKILHEKYDLYVYSFQAKYSDSMNTVIRVYACRKSSENLVGTYSISGYTILKDKFL